jgi:pilus assembly protein CpaB
MSRRMLLLLVALAVAATATLLTQRWLSAALAREAIAPAAAPTVDVLVAAHSLDIGSIIDRGALRWQPWPVAAAGGLLTRASASVSLDGAVVRVALVAGEPVTPDRVVRRGQGGTLAAVLARDARAVTIAVTPASGMAGFALPGDRVDLILTQTISSSGVDRHVSHTILRGLRVLGTDQRAAGGTASADDSALGAATAAGALASGDAAAAVPTTVTLETDAKGAEMIAVAGDLGKLSLSLRGLAAGAATDAPSRTWDSDATQIVPRAAPSAPVVTPVAYNEPATPPHHVVPAASGGMTVMRGIAAGATDLRATTTEKP